MIINYLEHGKINPTLLNPFPDSTVPTLPCTCTTVGMSSTLLAALQTCHHLEIEGMGFGW